MKNKINSIQNMCFAISTRENGKHFAWCEYYGHVNMLNVRMCLRSDRKYNYIHYFQIWLNDDDSEQKLRDVIYNLREYL